MKSSWLVLALMLCGTILAETNGVIRTVAELHATTSRKGPSGRPFEIHVTAITASPKSGRNGFIVFDETGRTSVSDVRKNHLPAVIPGDRIVVTGTTQPRHRDNPEDELVNAHCTNVVIISHGSPPPPISIRPEDLQREELRLHLVRIAGTLIDARTDRVDTRFSRLTLDCDGQLVRAATSIIPLEKLTPLIGAVLEVTGANSGNLKWAHRYGGAILTLVGTNDIRVLKPPSDAIFRAPDLDLSRPLTPETVKSLGRRKATGHVCAVWGGDMLLLRTGDGSLVTVNTIAVPPAVGSAVEAVGTPETDMFQIHLARAVWRPVPAAPPPPERVLPANIKDLFVIRNGLRQLKAYYRHGQTLRLRGKVQDVFANERGDPRIILEADGNAVTVDCSAAPDAAKDLQTGCLVEVTGVCILETETWNRHSILPRTLSMFIAVRAPEDLRVVSRPSWWTPDRLLAVIAGLILLLIAIFVWNASLQILAERRGRELYRRKSAQARSELRLEERTRLAAELHDHLAQNLTAVSYQISAAGRTQGGEPAASAEHLANAARMLGSCRTELRRCLWDLRSDALDEPDFALAIRKSIDPVSKEAKVDIDMKARRSKISDQVAHATLSIIRELVSNAVNHGHAAHIGITGDIVKNSLQFTVQDDGLGFRTDARPSSSEGHFGLEGVQERLRRYDGKMTLESSPGKGTCVTISLNCTMT